MKNHNNELDPSHITKQLRSKSKKAKLVGHNHGAVISHEQLEEWADMIENSQTYDSELDTRKHISKVRELLLHLCMKLLVRAKFHDRSKLVPPEKELFDKMTPKLKGSTYGSDEYYGFLEELKPALDHHYKHNSHHPEYYDEGIQGMHLIDIIEMLVDWRAASLRHNDGNIYDSIEKNQDRFEYSDELKQIFINTAKYMGWE